MYFSKHYTVEEARALLPLIRQWLDEIEVLRGSLRTLENQLGNRSAAGYDIGGENVNTLVKTLVDTQEVLSRFSKRQIQIKDVERGLIDFPSLRGGKEVFLCWEKEDEDIEFWHDLDSGFPGRERL